MKKRRVRPGPAYLKVIEGRGKSVPARPEDKDSPKPVYLFLVLTASLLIVQMLIGWVWGTSGQGSLSTVLAVEDEVDISFSVPGTITFEEKVVLAPCSGFVHYRTAEGQRVSVDKELAVITPSSLENRMENRTASKDAEKTAGTDGSLQRARGWLLGEKKEEEEGRISPLPVREEIRVGAPQPGLVSFCFEGLEEFGPQSCFPYFSEEELQDIICPVEPLYSGDKVYRFQPILKIINNYYWYFSAVIPRGFGEQVAEKPKVKLCFSFAPDIPVWGEQVELTERDTDGGLEITWRIGRELPGLYQQRRCEAGVFYKDIPGVLVPKSALVETEGRQGVYLLEKGLVRFQEIDLLLEREDDVLIKSQGEQQRIIANPEHVKKNQLRK